MPSGSRWQNEIQLSFFDRTHRLGAAVAAREFLHPPSRVDEFLFAGEKRMTSGADADFNVANGRAGMINRAARTSDIGLVILWMNVRFHVRKMSAKGSRIPQIRKQ